MYHNKIMKLIDDVALKIGYGEIMGSTESVEFMLDNMKYIISVANNVKDLAQYVTTLVSKSIKARPTSAMLINSSRQILIKLDELLDKETPLDKLKRELPKLIDDISVKAKMAIDQAARIASHRIVDGDHIMTISYSRSVLRTLDYAIMDGKKIKVTILESRPGGEGIIVAKILDKKGIPTTLIVDSAARFFVKNVTKVLMGAEAVAANGAVINKVGSSILALNAHEARVRVFVVAGINKFSLETVFGELVDIPTAKEETLLPPDKRKEIGNNLKVFIPLVDVTPPEYIDAIITDKGVIAPQAVPFLLKEVYGALPPKLPEIKDLIAKILSKVQ